MESGISTIDYKSSGVDIEAGNALVDAIKPLAKSTLRPGVASDLGGFGALFDLKAAGFRDPILVSTTDGVGTKLKLAIECGRHDTIGIDLVAMCVNDLIVQGAQPLFFLDYFASGHLSVKTGREIIAGIAEGCRQADCALIGGETAEMPGLYAEGDYDLAGFAVGAAEREGILTGATVQAGDVVLALASDGVHSNGYSLVRAIIARNQWSLSAEAPFESSTTLGEALLRPTRIYVQPVLAAIETGGVHALAHITGGGLIDNIPRVLPSGLACRLDASAWPLLPVFRWLKREANLPENELARTFNCGIGMVVIAAADRADALADCLHQRGEKVFRVGEIVSHDEARLILEGTDTAWRD